MQKEKKMRNLFLEAQKLKDSGEDALALQLYMELLAEGLPNWNHQIYYQMAEIFWNSGFEEEALNLLKEALRCKPDEVEYYLKLGMIAQLIKNHELAEQNFLQALRYGIENYSLYVNYALNCFMELKLQEAIVLLRKAIVLNPERYEAKFNLAQALLLDGQMEEGLLLLEARFFHQIYQEQNRFYENVIGEAVRWRGQSFSGRSVLILQDMGFGDLIQFSRYLPLVKARGGNVILAVKPELLNLCRELEGADEVVEAKQSLLEKKDFEYFLPAISLPLIFGTTQNTIPYDGAYISENLIKDENEMMSSGQFKVGLVWKSNDKANANSERCRSTTYETLIPLLDITGVEYYVLQKECGVRLSERSNVHECSERLTDFAATAKIIGQMDLVITVDTAVAHLAGAMGKQVWVMLPYLPDWRWMLERSDTPWYPSMRLFRPNRPADWKSIVEVIKQELVLLVKNNARV